MNRPKALMKTRSTTRKEVAFFKSRSTNCLPLRLGAVQCIRNCNNCIIAPPSKESGLSKENLMGMKSYDNLVKRKGLLFTKYQSIQYHVGQAEILKSKLEDKNRPRLNLYIVAANQFSDLNYLKMVLDHIDLPNPHIIDNNVPIDSMIETLREKSTVAIPIKLRSCASDRSLILQQVRKFSRQPGICFKPTELRDFLAACIGRRSVDSDFNINIIPINITKDHDKTTIFGLGSVVVQILEPYTLSAYLLGLISQQKATHLVQHVYADAARNAVVLPSHIVACLILHMDCGDKDGASLEKLTEYMDWMRKISIDTGMQLGFSGDSLNATKFALMILDNYVHLSPSDNLYRPRDLNGLMDYADLVLPYIAYESLLTLSILIEHNKQKSDEGIILNFKPEVTIKVMRDKVVATCVKLAEQAECYIACRRPCTTIERCVEDVILQMKSFGKYIKIEEPALNRCRGKRWAGESDDDEDDYFARNRDNPALQVWIVVTGRLYRRHKLNFFLNAAKSILGEDQFNDNL